MALNSKITQSPVILLLGAGASMPLGKPVMEQFVRGLVEQIEYIENPALLLSLVSARGYDLEKIMEDLETFLALDYISSFAFHSEPPYEASRSDAENLRSYIRHSIIREYRNIDANKAVNIYQPLLDEIFSHLDSTNHCLPIFTTNYDLAIESFCDLKYSQYDLVDGMQENGREVLWNRQEFDMFRMDHPATNSPESQKVFTLFDQIYGGLDLGSQLPKRNIVLFKLHGSVNWMRMVPGGGIVQSLPMYDLIDSDQFQNAIIYPAGNKVATSEPYLTAYHYFSRCCENAKIVVAIGYSFRDYDVLISLLKARQVNEKLQLLLLSPDAYNILRTIPDEDSILWITALHGSFGDTASSTKYLAEIGKQIARNLEGGGAP